jgi:DNA repair exonuclease SbcCD ATPase subunit
MSILDNILGTKKREGANAHGRIADARETIAKVDEAKEFFQSLDKTKAAAESAILATEAELAELKKLEAAADHALYMKSLAPEIAEMVALEKKARSIIARLQKKAAAHGNAVSLASSMASRLGVRPDTYLDVSPGGTMRGAVGRAIQAQRIADGERFADDVGPYLEPVRL